MMSVVDYDEDRFETISVDSACLSNINGQVPEVSFSSQILIDSQDQIRDEDGPLI